MIVFPCAKINLGLNIVSTRDDGYHNLETVFYPIPLYDALEIKYMDPKFPSDVACDLKVTGNAVDCDEQWNLVVRAYNLLAEDYELPRVHAHLVKRIPMEAGLGGGSSDGAFMIRLLDERFRLNIGIAEMERYAARLGADCAFFITAEPMYATGIGNVLAPVDNTNGFLKGYHIAIVKPNVSISTKDAYRQIRAQRPPKCCLDIVRQPVETWRDELTNDFEAPIFKVHPELKAIKQSLYDHGAVFSQMSGSGSAIYGIFRGRPQGIPETFPDMFTATLQL